MVLSFGYLLLRQVLQLIVLGLRASGRRKLRSWSLATSSRCCAVRSNVLIWNRTTGGSLGVVPAAAPSAVGRVRGHPGHPAALALRPDRAEVDLSPAPAGSPASPGRDPYAGAVPGQGESELGPSPDPGRTSRPGLPGGGQYRVVHPDQGRGGSRPAAHRADLDAVPERAGQGDPGLRFPARRHDRVDAYLRVVPDGDRHPQSAHPRRHHPPERAVGGSAGPQS